MRIMYVEDNPANLFLVKRVARMGNHDVLNYIDGEDALTYFERDNPDLVLMDLQLAGEMSGLDVVKKLRAAGYKTPMIAVTAYAMVGDRDRCMAAGCDDYLAKPLSVPRLVALIQHYAGQSAQEYSKPSDTVSVRPDVFAALDDQDANPSSNKNSSFSNGASSDSDENGETSNSPPSATTGTG